MFGPHFFLLTSFFMIQMMMNPHTITSPNRIMNAAPPALIASTVITPINNNVSNRIINKIIKVTLLSIKGYVIRAKAKRPRLRSLAQSIIQFFSRLLEESYFRLNAHAIPPKMSASAPTIQVIGLLTILIINFIIIPLSVRCFIFHKGVCKFRVIK